MRRRRQQVAAGLLALLLGAAPGIAAAAGERAEARDCAIAAGRDASYNQVTCNFGLTPEQVRELTDAVVRGATSASMDRIAELSRQLGVTDLAMRSLLRIVGEQDVPLDRILETLGRVAASYQQLRGQAAALDPDNPVARPLVEQARAAIASGELARARALLREATAAQLAAARQARALREKAEAAERAQLAQAAATTATQGEVASTEERFREAAELFAQAAELAPPDRAMEAIGYRERQATLLVAEGTHRGDNAALAAGIETWQRVLGGRSREREPLDWARAQAGLASALMTLGAREEGTAGTTRMEDAVLALRAALEAATRERDRKTWSETQTLLGTALLVLGGRADDATRLEEAVAALRAAQEERPRERVPVEWAFVQQMLGQALMILGAREGGTTRLEEAVRAVRAGLEEVQRDRDPLQWAMTQLALGNVLMMYGTRGGDRTSLEEAVAAFRAAQQETTRERSLAQWSTAQMGLGFSLFALGRQEDGTARLEAAVRALDDYLAVGAPFGPEQYLRNARAARDLALREIERRQGR